MLGALRKKISALASGAATVSANKAAAGRFLELVRGTFRDGKSADGVTWPALVLRSGQPLLVTGSLMRSYRLLRSSKNFFTVGSDSMIAAVQARGATIVAKTAKALKLGNSGLFAKRVVIPPRPSLPQGRLPDDWRAQVQSAGLDALKKAS